MRGCVQVAPSGRLIVEREYDAIARYVYRIICIRARVRARARREAETRGRSPLRSKAMGTRAKESDRRPQLDRAALARVHETAKAGGIAATWTPVAEVAAWPRNPKDHSAEHVDEIVASISKFGFSTPLVANSETGQLVAGHGRLLAAQQLGLEVVPVRWMSLSEADAELLALADNRLNEKGGYDDTKLAEILRRRSVEDREGLAVAGFDEDAIAVVLRRAPEPTTSTPETEWTNMPAFEQHDKNSVYHVTVHFRSEADVEKFFALIGQTKRTPSPKATRGTG